MADLSASFNPASVATNSDAASSALAEANTASSAAAGGVAKSLIDAANDFLVGSADNVVVKKTKAETKTILGVPATKTTVLFPEYPSAVLHADGSSNIGNMISDVEAEGNYRYNYYEWDSDEATIQDYDIVVKWKVPEGFSSWIAGDCLIIDFATELTTIADCKLDVILQEDNVVTTSSITSKVSTVAADWYTNQEGNALAVFANTDTILAALVAGDVLVITLRLYSKSNRYCRVGAITLKWST